MPIHCRVKINKSIAALPLSYRPIFFLIVDRMGFEPMTCRLTVEVTFIYDTCWLTPGLEPCSPHSQCGTLPVKLKPTFDVEVGFEPTPSVSKTDMLNHYTTQQFFGLVNQYCCDLQSWTETFTLWEWCATYYTKSHYQAVCMRIELIASDRQSEMLPLHQQTKKYRMSNKASSDYKLSYKLFCKMAGLEPATFPVFTGLLRPK
jgi:hypothetical protein